MTEPSPSGARRLAATLSFVAGGTFDVLIAPVEAMREKYKVAARALAEAGLPLDGAARLDRRRVVIERRHRRMRHLLLTQGPEAIAGRVETVGFERLQAAVAGKRGVILCSTHGGPPEVLPAATRLLGLDVLDLRQAESPPWGRSVVFSEHASTAERGRALIACRDELQRGGIVRTLFEGHARRGVMSETGARIGSVVVPAGGVAILARLSGAPTVPVVARVSFSGRVRIGLGAALEAPVGAASTTEQAEQAFTLRLHEAFETLLADDPVARLERLLWAIAIHGWRRDRSLKAPVDGEVAA